MNAVNPQLEIDPVHFRRVMGSFATGVTVIVAEANGETRGMTANAFMSGSLEPPLCVVSIAKRAHMHGHVTAAERFSVNILAAGQEDYATHFAGRPVEFFTPRFDRKRGVPVLQGVSATIAADIAGAHDCGDHTLFLGHIRAMEADGRPPLLYHQSRFAALMPIREAAPSLPEFW
jgi:flavin reductase (DIM6/NTAB) family NADH-FMN oxidoreductase RutF